MRDSSRARDKDLGVIQVLLSRLNTFRMPRALELKKRVARGEQLTDHDMQFLKTVLKEANEARRLAARHPKYQGVVDEMTALCQEIISRGLENEHGGASAATRSKWSE